MKEKLRAHVDYLFENAPDLPRIYDFKEELLANLQEKYDDLVAAGADPEQAYDTVVTGIGDTDSLIQILANEPQPAYQAAARQQTAQVVSTSVFLYCAALAALVFLERFIGDSLALVAFFLIAGLSTAQLVYHFMTRPVPTQPSVPRNVNTADATHRKKVQATLQSSLWLITVALYFIISFNFGNWHISWIIFLIAPVVSQLINLFLDRQV